MGGGGQIIDVKSLKRSNLKSAIIGAVIGFLLTFIILNLPVLSAKENWQGIYYPNGCLVCDEDYIFSPIFETKEECLNWAKGIQVRRNNESDLYECGKNCKWKNELMVCDETVDY